MGKVVRKINDYVAYINCVMRIWTRKITKWPTLLLWILYPINFITHIPPISLFCILYSLILLPPFLPLLHTHLTTQGQYLFVYDALLHALVFGNMEVGVAQLKDHLAALSKPAEDEEEGETRLEREFNVRVWLHVHTVCAYAGQCSCHACMCIIFVL